MCQQKSFARNFNNLLADQQKSQITRASCPAEASVSASACSPLRQPIWLQYLIWLPLIAVGAIALLQPTKGAVVALQWQLGLHGFEAAKKRRDLAAHVDGGRLVGLAH